MSFTKLDYCQYWLSSPINDTVTNLADPLESIRHECIQRYLRGERLTPRLLWDKTKLLLQPSQNVHVLFDDTGLDKRYSTLIESTCRQHSGNEHRVIQGIGLISCVYINGETGQMRGLILVAMILLGMGKASWITLQQCWMDRCRVSSYRLARS